MKSIRRILQLAVCVLLIHSCSDNWIEKEEAAENGENMILTEKPENITSIEMKENQKDGISLFAEEKKALNVLIIGSDQRGNEASRADTIMIAQYNSESKTAKIMSIMRDSYVFIPGYGKSKINHAYAWGGDKLLKETIEENFDVRTDRTLTIDFQGFVSIVDKVLPKGIEMEVPAEMINYWKWDMEPGKQVLNGQQLLNYVRFRKDSESDFGRVRRQQEVMEVVQHAITKQLTEGGGIKTVSSLMKEGKKAVETDLALNDLIKLGVTSMLSPLESFDSLRIPVKDTYKNVITKDDGLVLELDAEANAEAAVKFLGGEN
ncbi:LytR family transcriptional regulator [Rossellomorea vietnamensis]|uniref:Regulatory protein MsrR n=2 Tax=Bacillaceae TaxID=186817 RepID=A0A5D4MJ23_9BACI|nr:LCP family protein [Rossellomorea vietnamensis]TYS01607.1 LytR family transcriptional regulator [Rossellomorea vietnamensis]